MNKYMIVEPLRKHKKYSVLVWDNVDKKYRYLLSFGDSRYGQFYDRTPLKLYSHLNHNDPKRRAKYYARHGHTEDVNSPKFWSNTFLW